MKRFLAIGLAVCLASARGAIAPRSTGDDIPRSRAAIELAAGHVHLPISCRPEAQSFFDQGLAQFHGAQAHEAERSFREASARDPECAMAVWGRALVNRDLKLAREALHKQKNVSALETGLLDAYAESSRGRTIEKLRALARTGGTEVKALLVAALADEGRAGRAALSEADSLLDAILRAEPLHPALRYRIELWRDVDPRRAESALETCGASEPANPWLWELPGEIYFKTQRYAQALWHQEASERVAHAYFERFGRMPFLEPEYVNNSLWLVETLRRVGRARDAVAVARGLVDLPRHPRHETAAVRAGWDQLVESLEFGEAWEAVSELEKAPLPVVLSTSAEAAKWQRLRGVAAFHRGDGRVLSEARALVAGKAKPVEDELALLAALNDGNLIAARSHLNALEHGGLARATLAGYFARTGETAKARTLARQAVREAPGEVGPLTTLVEVLAPTDDARAYYQQLGYYARFADRDWPPFLRLKKALGEMPRVVAGIEWKEPRRHPALERMGPLHWTPAPAPSFTLTDAEGKVRRSEDLFTKPTLLIFEPDPSAIYSARPEQSARWRDAGIQTLRVSPASVEELAARRQSDVIWLSDPQHQAFGKFGARDDFENVPLHAEVLVSGGKILWRDRGPQPLKDTDDFLFQEATRLIALARAD